MAIILNLETSTTNCSVAIANSGKLLATKQLNNGFSHSENLMLFINDVMQQTNIKLDDIDAIAVSAGPGSYTGLRIGVSAAKGLCFGLEKPLIALDSLSVLTYAVYKTNIHTKNTKFLPMFDARRMEVYAAVLDATLQIVHPISSVVIADDSFQKFANEKEVLFFGDGAPKCRTYFERYSNFKYIENIIPSAQNMCELSNIKFLKNEFENVAYFEPNYLKEFYTTAKAKSN
jgi:tRNA threonylcarbamoyladenosine biosynthesis protein TsaB